ncbi:MAG: site-specific integrase [Nostoc sp. JL31]|uniref:site-specific integrase n=1 Tax=Nostoc sp. JL31 TaxID=2815395 RepID=UPI0025F2B52F|nr:site-specific integrase [Nostoc sp. JL31]MBN3889427.1 site-specific integrase [Nostoc sp. JL31]
MNSSEHTVNIFGLAEAIATQIEKDILAGHFDPILKSYCLVPKTDPSKPKTLLELWDLWVASLSVSERTLAGHYRYTRSMITKANPKLLDITWVSRWDLAPRTFRDRLSIIKSCCTWGVAKGYLDINPYEDIKAPKEAKTAVKPFDAEEVKKILNGFKELYPHYLPFVYFLFATGVRTSEAIGLTWRDIDFIRGEIVIRESLPKDPLGNGYTRVRKETKTGNIRYLNMNEEIRGLLLHIRPDEFTSTDLIFKAPKGGIVDADNFRERYWIPVLDAQGVPYRKPYTTRHTMASTAIEQGTPVTGVAYLLGHTDTTMVMKTYGHMINRPELPRMPIS